MKVMIKTMNTKNFEKKTLKCFGWIHLVKSVKNKYMHIMGTISYKQLTPNGKFMLTYTQVRRKMIYAKCFICISK